MSSRRRTIITELGLELECFRCKEFWPATKEFWWYKGDKPHTYCKACYTEWRREKGYPKGEKKIAIAAS